MNSSEKIAPGITMKRLRQTAEVWLKLCQIAFFYILIPTIVHTSSLINKWRKSKIFNRTLLQKQFYVVKLFKILRFLNNLSQSDIRILDYNWTLFK